MYIMSDRYSKQELLFIYTILEAVNADKDSFHFNTDFCRSTYLNFRPRTKISASIQTKICLFLQWNVE